MNSKIGLRWITGSDKDWEQFTINSNNFILS